MVDGGYDCIDRPNLASTSYCKRLSSPITKDGKIKSWCTYMNTVGTIGLRIYRLSGSDVLYIGGATSACAVGYQTHVADINVLTGDIVGIFIDSGDIDVTYGAGEPESISYNTGNVDVDFDTTTSNWNTDTGWDWEWSIGVIVSDEYYVKTTGNDSLDGKSWTNAWKTINKAATTVPDGHDVHIGFGTYDAEPATNKIAPQNVGTSGIYYIPETANTGGGTGTVSIEQNA